MRTLNIWDRVREMWFNEEWTVIAISKDDRWEIDRYKVKYWWKTAFNVKWELPETLSTIEK